MLIRFRVANYSSIRDEQELSFVSLGTTSSKEQQDTIRVPKYGIEVLRVLAVYGANASGKSNLLQALRFMCMAVVSSQTSWKPQGGIPRTPFLLDKSHASEPSFFEVDLFEREVRYTYGFVVDATQVVEEWLYAYPQGKKQKWFVRDSSQSKEFTFSRFLSGENKVIQSLTRSDSLFLSAAAQNNHQLLSPIFNWFSKSVRFVDSDTRSMLLHNTTREFRASTNTDRILSILSGADLGITGIDVEDEEVSNTTRKMLEIIAEDSPEAFKGLKLSGTFPRPSLRHKTHEGGLEKTLPFSEESHGTQVLFGLAGSIVQTLSSGSLLCVDELDAGLHPLIAVEIVRLFNDPIQNPNKAQLLFNTHDTNILECGGLRRDQIWFTEKDSDGATKLFPLSDYKPRKMENIKRGYLQGRYGGVPFIRPLDILHEDNHGK